MYALSSSSSSSNVPKHSGVARLYDSLLAHYCSYRGLLKSPVQSSRAGASQRSSTVDSKTLRAATVDLKRMNKKKKKNEKNTYLTFPFLANARAKKKHKQKNKPCLHAGVKTTRDFLSRYSSTTTTTTTMWVVERNLTFCVQRRRGRAEQFKRSLLLLLVLLALLRMRQLRALCTTSPRKETERERVVLRAFGRVTQEIRERGS